MREVYKRTGEKKLLEIAENCDKYIREVCLKSFNWEGQFEDAPVSAQYSNLSHAGARKYLRSVVNYYADNPDRIAEAEECMRYIEDQFVLWDKKPVSRHQWNETAPWHVPAGLEQYAWYVPIDDSTAEIMTSFAEMYKATGKEQAIRIEASSGLSKEEIDRMKAEAEANAEADKKEREKIDKLNQADSMIFQTEQQLSELGDKLPADKKAPIENALNALKDAHKAQDLAAIDKAMAELQTAFQAASAEMYAQSGAQGQPGAGAGCNGADCGGAGCGAGQSSNTDKSDVQDADFEEVK